MTINASPALRLRFFCDGTPYNLVDGTNFLGEPTMSKYYNNWGHIPEDTV
jgi:hypothetical protein